MKPGRKIGFKHSELTKKRIGFANRGVWIQYPCNNCKKECQEKHSHYKKSKTHFCGMKCYKQYQSKLSPQEQNAYRGVRQPGESKQVYHRRYVAKHPERIAHLKARRYAREKSALGSHSLEEWQRLKKLYNDKCAICNESKPLTKDHIKPLSLGGTDFINNIQPLCKNCNSKKWKKYNQNPELIKS